MKYNQAKAIEDLIADFALLDDWEARYEHVIELGRKLEPLTAEEHNEQTKVRGCASQVWLVTDWSRDKDPILHFRGDSDAHIVRGLIAILTRLYNGRRASEVGDIDAKAVFERIGLTGHLSAQRSNGLASMVKRLEADAAAIRAPESAPRR